MQRSICMQLCLNLALAAPQKKHCKLMRGHIKMLHCVVLLHLRWGFAAVFDSDSRFINVECVGAFLLLPISFLFGQSRYTSIHTRTHICTQAYENHRMRHAVGPVNSSIKAERAQGGRSRSRSSSSCCREENGRKKSAREQRAYAFTPKLSKIKSKPAKRDRAHTCAYYDNTFLHIRLCVHVCVCVLI